ncbi:iron ABC transporter permease [Clostridium carnis]
MNRFRRSLKKNINGWAILSLLGILLVLMPTVDIIINLFEKPNDNWFHVKEFLLKEYTVNSLKIALFTALFTLIIGVFLAWIVSMYEFRGRKFFSFALMLPMAIPGYIAAYTYSGMLSYTGVVQKILRNSFGLTLEQKYFNIMSLNGAIFIFTFFLFPYVYIITKAFLENQSSALIENARILGHKPTSIFFKIILPVSRPSIIAGLTLVILEVFSDFGVVNYYGVSTFSTAIFKTWFGMGDVNTAIRLSGILMMFVIALMVLENIFRGRRKYSYTTSKVRPIKREELKGIKGLLAFLVCGIIFSLSFLIPVIQLINWAFLSYKNVLNHNFIELLKNTVFVAAVATIIIIFFGVVVANFCRMNKSKISKAFSKIITIGYSIPGAIIAIGVIVLFVSIDRGLVEVYKGFGITNKTLVLSGSVVILIFAYVIRFLAVGFNNIESGFEKVGNKYFEASRMLGLGVTKTFFKVDMKMIKGAIVSGAILTFVDILKELPLTMTLKPFNFETLATQTYKFANDERLHEAAIPALIIIIVSIISIYIFQKVSYKRSEKNAS